MLVIMVMLARAGLENRLTVPVTNQRNKANSTLIWAGTFGKSNSQRLGLAYNPGDHVHFRLGTLAG